MRAILLAIAITMPAASEDAITYEDLVVGCACCPVLCEQFADKFATGTFSGTTGGCYLSDVGGFYYEPVDLIADIVNYSPSIEWFTYDGVTISTLANYNISTYATQADCETSTSPTSKSVFVVVTCDDSSGTARWKMQIRSEDLSEIYYSVDSITVSLDAVEFEDEALGYLAALVDFFTF
jgi:hypothetical protein